MQSPVENAEVLGGSLGRSNCAESHVLIHERRHAFVHGQEVGGRIVGIHRRSDFQSKWQQVASLCALGPQLGPFVRLLDHLDGKVADPIACATSLVVELQLEEQLSDLIDTDAAHSKDAQTFEEHVADDLLGDAQV